jgi:hypothetical protein
MTRTRRSSAVRISNRNRGPPLVKLAGTHRHSLQGNGRAGIVALTIVPSARIPVPDSLGV